MKSSHCSPRTIACCKRSRVERLETSYARVERRATRELRVEIGELRVEIGELRVESGELRCGGECACGAMVKKSPVGTRGTATLFY
jgi:hypothetical protein